MGFRYNQLGELVAKDPVEARIQLQQMVKRYGSLSEVARVLSVDRRTVGRWAERLARAGHPLSAPPRGRPRTRKRAAEKK